MDIEAARYNMVEQQIRPWEVLDTGVLDLLFRIKREEFVPKAWRNLAFVDMEIPLGHGEVMLAPRVEARILQLVAVKPTERVLEIGTGSGYLTALLASEAAHVVSVDIEAEFTAAARARLAEHGIGNVTLETGDAASGWSQGAPYDVIVVTGSLPMMVDALLQSLNIGGRLFAVTGEGAVMEAGLVTRTGPERWESINVFETVIPPLRNARHPDRFCF